jgi:DNA-binding LytR/AlgR family response regulator
MSDKLKIAICDDNSESRALIQSYLLRMLAKQIDSVEIFTFENSLSLLKDYPADLDILFLDIVMDQLSGMECAHRLRQKDAKVNIVFVTNMPQFAIEGYKVHAFGYLLKPISYESFQLELWELIQQIFREKQQGLLVKDGGTTRRLKFGEILFVETNDRQLLLHTSSRAYPHKATMADLEKALMPYGFIRCHNAYLVNLAFVSAMTGTELELADGRRISVSRSKRSDCAQALARFIGAKV